ncbi:hypothetical protein ACOBQX_12115 [Actinokineospora sp. G85]|uniref:hypothetical protein n=1 Tax=Actinokineospora sp. G85 TaxID=3406626 RepID=UPI003C77480F
MRDAGIRAASVVIDHRVCSRHECTGSCVGVGSRTTGSGHRWSSGGVGGAGLALGEVLAKRH